MAKHSVGQDTLDQQSLRQDFSDQLPHDSVSLDPSVFDNLLRAQGVSFVHYRAIPCPVGMSELGDTRRPHEDHSKCSNGYIYSKVGHITCAFSGNSKQSRLLDVGILNGSQAQVTIPRYYDDTLKTAVFAPGDRMYLEADVALVTHYQRFECHATGIDRLSFPVVEVEFLVDSHGIEYSADDYSIENGRLRWKAQPQKFPSDPRGPVCAIRYQYRPFFYVDRVMHELRVIQITDPVTGERSVQRLPVQLSLQRENIYVGSQNDDAKPGETSGRAPKSPGDQNFGPR